MDFERYCDFVEESGGGDDDDDDDRLGWGRGV
jgi:hypothetical protein